MAVLISLAMAILPVILLVVYFYRRDKNKPEPKGLVLKIFIFGVLAIIPALAIEAGLIKLLSYSPHVLFIDTLIKAFVIAALTEEWLKLQVVKRFAYKKAAFDEVMDGIVYAVTAGLGFACLENILYVVGSGKTVAIVRAFTAVPGHALWAGLMGFYIGMAKFSGSPEMERKYLRKGLLVAVLTHGLYDFFVFAMPDMQDLVGAAGSLIALGIVPLLIYAFVRLRRLMKTAIAGDTAAGRVGTSGTESA
jgi:RsiW-degrading membrane proteinase PrsW (M82 family)